MHRCLEIQEVVRIIVDNIQHDPAYYHPLPAPIPPIDGVSLARLARTCRLFSGLALDALWCSQSSLVHLLKCLPDHLWEMVDSPPNVYPRRKFRFRSVIRQHDWDRALTYSSRIREISLGGVDDESVLEVAELLSVSLPVTGLLPNLRTLSWKVQAPTLYPYIRLFLAPSITSISLSLTGTATHLSLLSYLSSKLPFLTSARIYRPWDVPMIGSFRQQMTEEVTSFILALNNVQQLTIPTVLPTAFSQLASLSTLKTLAILSLDGCPSPTQTSSHMHSNFPSLETLDVRTSSVQFGKNLLQWCSDTPLQDFHFSSGAIATNLVVSDFLVTLRDHCGHYSLTTITLQFGRTFLGLPGDATHYEMTPTVLRPLLVFCNLSYLRVSSPREFCLDNDFVETMSTAWPKLKCLNFQVSARDHAIASGVGGSVTIAALVAFARRCPDLYELEIDLDANVVPGGPHPSPRGPRVRQMNLKYLTLWASPIESPSLVAHFLSSIFPCLRDIDVCHEHGLDEAEEEELHREGRSRYHKWVEVAKLVPLLAAARSDEEVFWSTNSAKMVSETV